MGLAGFEKLSGLALRRLRHPLRARQLKEYL
jgi:hypothetical protein